MSIRPLENLWHFALDNPEISIFIVTALFGGLTVKTAVPIHKFTTQDNTPLLKNELATENINNSPDNLDSTDWVAGIDWVKAFDREHASRDTDHFIATLCEIRDSCRLASLRKTFGT